MAQTQDVGVFPDTKIEEEVVTRSPKGVLGIADEALGITDESKEAVRFGDQPGQLIVNPLNVNRVFNYGEYFDKDFFDQNKDIEGMLLGNNQAIEFDRNLSYEDKIELFNQYQPKLLFGRSDTELDTDGQKKTTGIYNVDERVDTILRSNIEEKIQSEVDKGVRPTIVPNPFTEAPAPFSMEYYKKDPKTGRLLPSYQESPGRRAKEFLRFLDKSFPNMGAKTKASLVNRNIYGRVDLNFKMPDEKETDTAGSGLVLGEKLVTLATDIPRAIGDLIITGIGAGGELAYDGFKNLYNAASREATFKDQYQILYQGDGWYVPNPFAERGRDLIRSFLGPDSAEVYQKRLAQDNILVTKEQANKILNYTSDAADAITLVTPQLLGEAALLAKVTQKGARKLFEEDFKLYEANNKNLKGPELVQGFLDERRSKLPIYNKLKTFLDKNKLKEGADLAESAKPIEQRSLVIEANDRLKSLRGELADAIKTKRAEYKSLAPEAKAVMTPLLKKEYLNTEEIFKLKAQVTEAEMFVRMAEQTSAVPKYMRDMFKDTTYFATIAAATGQQLTTSFGVDPQVGYLVGMGTLMVANFTQGSNLLGIRSYLENRHAYNETNMLTVLRKSGAFEEGTTSQDVLAALRNPVLDGVNPLTGRKFTSSERKLALDLSKRINSLAPEIRDQVVANIMYYKDMRKSLAKAGIPDELLETSFADMSGLALFDALEDSFYYSVSQSKAFDKGTQETFLSLQNSRTKLMQSLEGHLNNILQLKVDKNNPAIVEFTGKISEALSDTKLKGDELRSIADAYVKSKAQLLQSYLHGHDIKGVQDAINAEYGDVMEMADSLLDDTLKLSLLGDMKSVQQSRENLKLIEDSINKEFYTTIANQRSTINDRAGKIPNINEINLAKYNDENASLGRLAIMSRKMAKARARLPFQEFDIKYGNQFGTDASELGLKILDDITAGDRASKGLASQLMTSGDEAKIFSVLNSGARKTIDAIIEATGNVEFRTQYMDEIRDSLPDALKNKPITDLDIVSYAIKNDNLNVGIALSMDETLRLYSALSAKSYKAYRSNNTGVSQAYGEYAKAADKLFDNVVDARGVPVADDALKQINDELVQMRLTYQNEYTTPYMTKNTNVARWTNPESATVVRRKGEVVASVDNAQTPGGKKWSSGNEPNTWFDLQKVSNMSEGDIVNRRRDLLQMYGRYDQKTDGYIIDPNGQVFKGLKEIASIKFEKEVRRLQSEISDPTQLRDAVDKLRRNTETLFRTSDDANASIAFDYNESMDIMTELGSRIQRDAKLKAAHKKEFIDSGLQKSLRKDAATVYTSMRNANEKIKMLQDIGGVQSGATFFEKFISKPNGLQDLKALKTAMTSVQAKGKLPVMTAKEFDDYVKEIVSTHISRTVIKPTGTTTIIPTTDETGKTVYKAVKDTNMDTDALTKFLDGEGSDVLIANLKQSGYIDDEHLNNLRRINTFMANRKRQVGRRTGDIRITGEPRGLSVESYISRFYSISRQVVSPKYVATEALIQNIRMSEHRMLKEMITNPKVASIMADLIVDGKKFTEEQELRLKEVLTVMAANALASGAITAEDEMKSGQKLPVYDLSKFKK